MTKSSLKTFLRGENEYQEKLPNNDLPLKLKNSSWLSFALKDQDSTDALNLFYSKRKSNLKY